jgi:mannose-6-phosphate isomerase-like protein (cupin superfamily)
MRWFVWLFATALFGAEVDPTFIRRTLASAPVVETELTTESCKYRALFGAGDTLAKAPKVVARYGEITVAGGACRTARFPSEEQIYVVLEGEGTLLYGGNEYKLRRDDFVYLPPGSQHGVAGRIRAIWMGFRVPAGSSAVSAEKPLMANLADVPKQVVGNHPPSTLYQLMMGDAKSTRDKIAAGIVMNSLFVMEFAPGGTNAAHHHEREEEVYLLLDGSGEIVAGGGRGPLPG